MWLATLMDENFLSRVRSNSRGCDIVKLSGRKQVPFDKLIGKLSTSCGI